MKPPDDPAELVRPELRRLTAYHLDLSPCRHKLDQNESPFEAPPPLKRRVAAQLAAAEWSRYPDFHAGALRRDLGAFHGWPAAGVLVGNGSNELLDVCLSALVQPGSEVLGTEPSFGLYRMMVLKAGGVPRFLPAMAGPATAAGAGTAGTSTVAAGVAAPTAVAAVAATASAAANLDLRLPIEALLAEVARQPRRPLLLCSPNNPTGDALPVQAVEALLELQEGPLLLDNAYGEFSRHDYRPLLDRHPRLILLRTFSKAWALAGLRLGYLLADPRLVAELLKVKLPYNLGHAGVLAGRAALAAAPAARRRIAVVTARREPWRQMLAAAGLQVMPSEANFLLTRCPTPAAALAVRDGLAARGIRVRDVGAYPGLAGCLRISVGSGAALRATRQALAEIGDVRGIVEATEVSGNAESGGSAPAAAASPVAPPALEIGPEAGLGATNASDLQAGSAPAREPAAAGSVAGPARSGAPPLGDSGATAAGSETGWPAAGSSASAGPEEGVAGAGRPRAGGLGGGEPGTDGTGGIGGIGGTDGTGGIGGTGGTGGIGGTGRIGGRRGEVQRSTGETRVRLALGLDGGKRRVEVGNGFFGHMLEALATHGGLGLEVTAAGDLHVDLHHTVEDVGIAFGEALDAALGQRRGVTRFGSAFAPLDEALARAVVDLSGRGFFAYDAPRELAASWVTADFPLTLVADFFQAVADRGRLTLHLEILAGRNGHHAAEAAFKAAALALRQAVALRASPAAASPGAALPAACPGVAAGPDAPAAEHWPEAVAAPAADDAGDVPSTKGTLTA
jgi:histidinol-phosphate/aromatic aminotransferase/cobyric acid decarboxylase-like protein/imidazoleglycerol phosphate dehydratase HisB